MILMKFLKIYIPEIYQSYSNAQYIIRIHNKQLNINEETNRIQNYMRNEVRMGKKCCK